MKQGFIVRTIAALALLSLPALAKTDVKPIKLTLRPLTKNFSVLGTAEGAFVVENNTGCLMVAPIKLSRPPVDTKSAHIDSLRFGIAVANGRTDWKPVVWSSYWPLDINTSSKEEATVGYAFGCFQMPRNLMEGQYWFFMQIAFNDSEGHNASTYSATEEYWKLIDVPKDLPLTPAPLPQGARGTNN